MTDSKDVFRPTSQPSQRIYDAFQDEAAKRENRMDSIDWEHKERLRVFREARDYAQENRLPVLTLDQIRNCESLAIGHTDYGAKWAYAVAKLLKEPQNEEEYE